MIQTQPNIDTFATFMSLYYRYMAVWFAACSQTSRVGGDGWSLWRKWWAWWAPLLLFKGGVLRGLLAVSRLVGEVACGTHMPVGAGTWVDTVAFVP